MSGKVTDWMTPDEVHDLVIVLLGQLGGRVDFTRSHIDAAQKLQPELIIHRFDEWPARFVAELRPAREGDE